MPIPDPAAGSADRRPHALYVAWGFPPCRGGGVYRALATANAFARGGFRVTVLTATRESFARYTGTDESLEAQVDPAVRVVRVPFDWPARETDLRTWSPLRAAAPRVWWHLRKRADLRRFPEYGYGPWRSTLERAALTIHRDDPVDLVVASANPYVDFAAADALHRRHGIPYVMDYRDAWMLDVFGGGLLHPDGGRVDRLERELLSRARQVWFVNDPIRRWHADRHPDVADRMRVVANGYDPQLAPRPRRHGPPSERPLVFGYLGTATSKVPLAEFGEGWRLARERDPALREARAELWGYLGFYATPSPELATIVARYRDDGLDYHGPVAKSDVAEWYSRFNALALILGTGRYVTSGKVYEYLAAALPVVSVHDPGNAASDVLTGYPLWFPAASLSPSDIADALSRAADGAREADEQTRSACAAFAARFSRDLQLAPRVTELLAGLSSWPGRGDEAAATTPPDEPAALPDAPTPSTPRPPSDPPDADGSSAEPEPEPEPEAAPFLSVVVLRTGAAPGATGTQNQADARRRLGLLASDRLDVLGRRSKRALPALLATLTSSRSRSLVAQADVLVAPDRAAASVAWVLARLNRTADAVTDWDAAAAAIRSRRRRPGHGDDR